MRFLVYAISVGLYRGSVAARKLAETMSLQFSSNYLGAFIAAWNKDGERWEHVIMGNLTRSKDQESWLELVH